jgi:hypothetical protein
VQDPIGEGRVNAGLYVCENVLEVAVLIYYCHVVVVPHLLGKAKACIGKAHNEKRLLHWLVSLLRGISHKLISTIIRLFMIYHFSLR